MAHITCAFCRGKGKDPFDLLSELSRCQVCEGRGKVSVQDPVAECPACGGTGIDDGSRVTCTVCSGKGSIQRKSSPR